MQSNIWKELCFEENSKDKNDDDDSLCHWQAIGCLLVAMQPRLGLELEPSRAQTLTNRSFLIVDSDM